MLITSRSWLEHLSVGILYIYIELQLGNSSLRTNIEFIFSTILYYIGTNLSHGTKSELDMLWIYEQD